MKRLVQYDQAIKRISEKSDCHEMPGAYAVARVRSIPDGSPSEIDPMESGLMSVMLIMSGSVDIEINQERFLLNDGALLLVPPQTYVRLHSIEGVEVDLYLLVINEPFLHDININYSALSLPVPFRKPSPVFNLDAGQKELMSRYFGLLGDICSHRVNQRLDSQVAASLLSAMVYQMAQFYYKELSVSKSEDSEPGRRPSNYVSEFMRLLHLHYMSERSVSFYADKLFISPKYLSLLVKKATGRSASRWIDERVIMEARNQLRYSGKNIQQVAYMLNFTNQSAFGKYFKHLTGMSPTEYQKS